MKICNDIDFLKNLENKKYRLNNLYHIINREGSDLPFRLNLVQENVLDNLHTRNLILKARQLGMSTFSVLYLLDDCIWNSNISAGIVSYSLEHAQHIFKRIIGYALDHLPQWLRVDVINRSAREITFSNGSILRVDTTLRGGAYQLVLVSEFGKTCSRNPQKAEEVITGTLQTVPANGMVIIESTGEGNEGFFADMVVNASRRGNEELSNLDYKLFFYNWLQEPSYSLEEKISYDVSLTDYFNKIEKELNCKISKFQRNWYAVQARLLGDKIKQEFPSTVSEAFLSSSDAFYFAEAISKSYEDNRCLYTSLYDALLPVYVAMDIGVNDLTVIAFFQIAHGEIRVIDYYEDMNKGVDFYAKFLLQDKKYLYHTIFLPHDSTKRDALDASNTYERDFNRLFSGTNTKFHVLKRMDKQLSISHAKVKFERCVFNISKVKPFLDKLAKYRKKWNEALGRYMEEPLHNEACFVGETLIETAKGKVKICDIIPGDMVKTPNGFKAVLEFHKYKTKKLVSIQLKGKSITCTPHHKIFTKKGIVTADALHYNFDVITLEESYIWKKIASLGREKNLGFKDFFLSMNMEQLSCLTDIHIEKTNMDIGLEEQQEVKTDREVCIEQFGSISKGKSLKITMYTMLTGINQIILSKIWRLLHIVNTCVCICLPKKERSFLERVLGRPLNQQKNGIELRKGKDGIVNMQKKQILESESLLRNVFSVKKNISVAKNLENTVIQIVNQDLEEDQEKTTKLESVKSVLRHSKSTSLQRNNVVVNRAELCLDIEKEVFDLTVDEDNCYFANGILVSNSNHGDCFQYLCQAVGHLETVSSMGGALEKHRKAVESRLKRI